MKTLGVVILMLVVGCAAKPTLEELEAEALKTGDRSANFEFLDRY